MSPEARAMDSSDLSGEEAKPEAIVHKDRVGADPTEGWRRGTRGELRKSCDTCTASKTKCCGGIPCDRCKKRNLSCKFSKRRRCGPKARSMEKEKRARTGTSEDGSGEACASSITSFKTSSGGISPPRYTPVSAAGITLHGSQQPLQLPGSSLPMLPSPSHRPAPVFEAPLTADGLSGLVGIIAPTPTLSDGGGSGTSGASEELSGSYRPLSPRQTSQHLQQQKRQEQPHEEQPHEEQRSQEHQPQEQQHPGITGMPCLLAGGNASPHRVSTIPPTSTTIAPTEHSVASELNSIPIQCAALLSHHRTEHGSSQTSQWKFMDTSGRSRDPSPSTSPGSVKPSVDLIRPSHGLEDAPVSVPILDAPNLGLKRLDVAQDRSAMGPTARRPSSLKIRGPIPMDPLPAPASSYLGTFLKSVGSLLPLPGIESLRDALAGWEAAGCQDEDMTDVVSPADKKARAFGTLGSARLEKIEDSMEDDNTSGEDPSRDRTFTGTDDVKISGAQAKPEPAPSITGSTAQMIMNPALQVGKTGDLRQRDNGDASLGADVGSEFEEACRAEAWAAVAVGALFSGLQKEDAAPYTTRSLQALPRCLDAQLPEVASTFLLLTLFWLHSMEKQKVARYFGFAQQVGVELGSLMPDGLRHSLAFMSVLVNIALGPDKEPSCLGVAVRDLGWWGLSTGDRSGTNPRIRALGAITVACDKMVEDSKGQIKPFSTVHKTTIPAVPLPQSLTDLLDRAQEGLPNLGAQDPKDAMRTLSDDAPVEHLVALLNGLKAYAHARRGESAEAEAAARTTLNAVNRDPGILHLPLTFTLADTSKRIVESSPGGDVCGQQRSLPRTPGSMSAFKENPVSSREKVADPIRTSTGFENEEAGMGIIGMDTSPTRVGLMAEGGQGLGEGVTIDGTSTSNLIGAGSWCPIGAEDLRAGDSGGRVAGTPRVCLSPKGLVTKSGDNPGELNTSINGGNSVSNDVGNKTGLGVENPMDIAEAMRNYIPGSSSMTTPMTTPMSTPPAQSPTRSASTTPPPEVGRGIKISRAELMSRKWKPSSVGDRLGGGSMSGQLYSTSLMQSSGMQRSAKSNHPTTVGRARSLDDHMPSRWPPVSGPVSPRIVSGPDPPADWMQRIRSVARSPSPGMVGRTTGGRSTPSCDPLESEPSAPGTGVGDTGRPASSASGRSLGSMPVHPPPQSPRFASEPPGLALLSGVAAPSTSFQPTAPCLSMESNASAGGKQDAKCGAGGDRVAGVSNGRSNNHSASGAGGRGGRVAASSAALAAAGATTAAAAADDDDDADLDEPLPSHGLAMASQVSFDPNREDSTLHEYIFPSMPQG